jgi:hypothetical protein
MGKVNRNALREGYKLHWYTIKEILGKGAFFITYLSAINEYRVNDSVSWNELAVFNWDMEKDSFWI